MHSDLTMHTAGPVSFAGNTAVTHEPQESFLESEPPEPIHPKSNEREYVALVCMPEVGSQHSSDQTNMKC